MNLLLKCVFNYFRDNCFPHSCPSEKCFCGPLDAWTRQRLTSVCYPWPSKSLFRTLGSVNAKQYCNNRCTTTLECEESRSDCFCGKREFIDEFYATTTTTEAPVTQSDTWCRNAIAASHWRNRPEVTRYCKAVCAAGQIHCPCSHCYCTDKEKSVKCVWIRLCVYMIE